MEDKIEILKRSRGFVIVKKPIGSDSEDKGEGSVPALVRKTLSVDYAEPCHRLDKVVSGCMMVATDKKSAASISEAVKGRDVEKEYLCICEGSFADDEREGEMKDLLFFDRSKQKSFVSKKIRHGVKEASLEYKVLDSAEFEGGRTLSLVKIKLHTGRTHQIRVQFASRRHPLCGDGKYGSRDNKCSPALLSHAITFRGERTECLPDPSSYPWNMFNYK